MEHNKFKFTLKVKALEGTPKALIKEYIVACCDSMPQPCCLPAEYIIHHYLEDEYLIYLNLIIKDYGVPQVGIGIIAGWIEMLYSHCIDFSIETMIIHPNSEPPTNGAIITWDEDNRLIIRSITDAI